MIAQVCLTLGYVEVCEPVLFRTTSAESKEDHPVELVDYNESRDFCLDELGNSRGIRRLGELAVFGKTSDLGSQGVIAGYTVSCSSILRIELGLPQKLFGYPNVP